jgi:hypothetical protein
MKTIQETLEELALVSDMLNDRGDIYDVGCSEEQFYTMIKSARRNNPHKPIRILRDWIWWQIEYPQAELDKLSEKGLQPARIRADSVLFDETEMYESDHWIITSLLVEFRHDCLFESEDMTYILCGPGTRKCLTPEQIGFFLGLS